MADETLLSISGQGVQPFSARNLTQTLEQIGQFDKYRSRISCEDAAPPAFDAIVVGLWRRTVNGALLRTSLAGSTLTVDCAAELSYLTSGGSPSRTVVPGSSRIEGDYTVYRPRLTMAVIDKSQSFDELEAVHGWQFDLEEI